MDGFNIFFQWCHKENALSLEDAATMCCVSKAWKTALVHEYSHNNTLCLVSLMKYGVREELLQDNTIHMPLLVKLLTVVRRVYDIRCRPCETALQKVLKELTETASQMMFLSWKNLQIETQSNTVKVFIDLMHHDKDCVRVIACYLMYYFILKLCKRNSTEFLQSDRCIFSIPSMKFIITRKAIDMTHSLRTQVFYFPYGFIEKLIRILNCTRREIVRL